MTIASEVLWNPTDYPLPPLQPKEVGYSLYTSQFYHDVASGKVVFDIEISSYEYLSYQHLSTFSITTHGKTPLVQLAYNNYTNPASNTANYLVEYDGQQCIGEQIEGESPYMGYDYYRNLLLSLYYSGSKLYFEEKESEVGLLLIYSALVPFPGQYPRNITYSASFQNSTGYLVQYNLVGTEYCCTTNTYFSCPNSGLCDDGSVPTLTLARTNQTSLGYNLYNATQWPDNFFTYTCPFNYTSSEVTSLSSSDSDNDSSDNHVAVALAITFGILFGVTLSILLIKIYLDARSSKKPLAESKDTVEASAKAPSSSSLQS